MALVEYLGTHEFAWVRADSLVPFTGRDSNPVDESGKPQKTKTKRAKFHDGVLEAEELMLTGYGTRAAESLDASPGTEHVLTLRKRNGFFRIALQHGVKLVPVFSFGENALYDAVTPTGVVKRTQVRFLKFFGFAVPVYLGAGSNSAVVGSPIPHRRPVYTVVGDPIACPTIEHPTQTEIDDLKRVYIERLEAVFQRFAADCGAKEHRLKIEK